MCQADVAKIIEVKENSALVNFKGKEIEVNIELLEGIKPNDLVIFAGGIAIEKITKERAVLLGNYENY